MTKPTINTEQARELAIAFASEITGYILTHKTEYLAYLERTGQEDDNYRLGNIEAADLICGGDTE